MYENIFVLPYEVEIMGPEGVYENISVVPYEELEIMSPGSVDLESLLQVSRQVRLEVQGCIGAQMKSIQVFRATCHNPADVYEASRRAHTIFAGEVPQFRHIQVTFTNKETGSWH